LDQSQDLEIPSILCKVQFRPLKLILNKILELKLSIKLQDSLANTII
jgi:hypothetical protein